MGASLSADARAERERSLIIDRQIEEDIRRRKSRPRKVLLLDSGNSGKSTITKQMKIIHENGYTLDELAEFRLVVYKNLVDSAKYIVRAMNRAGVDCTQDTNRTHATNILTYEIGSDLSFRLSAEIVWAITSLLQDPIVATLVNQSSGFFPTDSAHYFLNQVQRIGQSDYIPSESDVLHVEDNTADISEIQFTFTQSLFDISGLRAEPEKWPPHFESITSVIFCVGPHQKSALRWRPVSRLPLSPLDRSGGKSQGGSQRDLQEAGRERCVESYRLQPWERDILEPPSHRHGRLCRACAPTELDALFDCTTRATIFRKPDVSGIDLT